MIDTTLMDEGCPNCGQAYDLDKRMAELKSQSIWQPMETAPTDGTPILALCLEDYPQVVKWHSEIDYGDEGVSQIWKSVLTDKFVIPIRWMSMPDETKLEKLE